MCHVLVHVTLETGTVTLPHIHPRPSPGSSRCEVGDCCRVDTRSNFTSRVLFSLVLLPQIARYVVLAVFPVVCLCAFDVTTRVWSR